MYKLSYHSGSFYDYELDTLIPKLSDTGYDAIELNAEKYPWEKGEPHLRPDMNQKEIKHIQQTLMRNGLEISSISAHIPLIHVNLDERAHAVEFTKQLLLIAKQLDVEVVHGLSGKIPDTMNEEEAMETLAQSINEIVSFAEQHGLKFALETIASMAINNGERFKALRNRVTTGRLYINLDTSNVAVAGDNLTEFIKEFKEDIVHIHIKDGIGTEASFAFPPLGQGTIDFQEVVSTLEEVGYSGYLSVEYVAHIFGYETEIEKVPESSYHYLKSIICRRNV